MPIQILPARLANQIAAGEVVERPASVIKELVENALDAGATSIEIDVEKGGSKLIRIRDNGCGIAKDELALALSRHATSKITTFDDLENITSLGFRGEALASISSVSRLKLTSKPHEQTEAWQAYAEGRDMAVKIIPAAHPDGTTIEVVDLFFNTPARRKFLRTEKTEFYHIDELIKRIALSRFDVQFSLKHNGKVVRKLPRALQQEQKDRRIGQICAKSFADNAVHVACDYEGINLSGYIALPSGCRNQNDIQYSYVNGRMMRDKLINHAIRQSYGQQLNDSQYPAYVLYLQVDPKQIDVNVHPAKHEVRFHQARLVHDFIVQALEQALTPEQNLEYYELEQVEPEESVQHNSFVREPEPITPLYPGQVSQPSGPVYANVSGGYSERTQDDSRYTANRNASGHGGSGSGGSGKSYSNHQPTKRQLDSYHYALNSFSQPITPSSEDETEAAVVTEQIEAHTPQTPTEQLTQPHSGEVETQAIGRCLSVIESRYALYQMAQQLFLLDLQKVNGKVAAHQHADGLLGQPLLLPVKMPLSQEDSLWLEQHSQRLNALGVEFECLGSSVVIRKVPAIIRNHNISDALTALFAKMNEQDHQQSIEWLYGRFSADSNYDLMTATELLVRGRGLVLEQELVESCGVAIDINTYIQQLTDNAG